MHIGRSHGCHGASAGGPSADLKNIRKTLSRTLDLAAATTQAGAQALSTPGAVARHPLRAAGRERPTSSPARAGRSGERSYVYLDSDAYMMANEDGVSDCDGYAAFEIVARQLYVTR